MAYSYVRYSGNGSTTNYTFSFPTISTDHIKVRVNGTLVTNWSFLNSSTIQFAAAPASGTVIEIRRETPKDSTIVNFTDGSVLLERDLDLLATWQLYLGQETEDDIEDTIRVDSQSRFDAQNRRIINVADPINAQDAVTKVYADAVIGQATAAASAAAAVQVALAADEAVDSAASALAAASSASSAAGSATTATTQATNAAASAVSAANSAAAAATALDNFDDRYLGQKASDPSADNDGNALVTGALYYNTTDSAMRVYTGTGWINASSAQVATIKTYVYVATAAQTTFSGNDVNGSSLTYVAPYLIVSLNGLELRPVVDYTATSGLSVVLTAAATSGDELQIQAFSAFNVANIQAANVAYSQGATGATNRSVDTKLKEFVSVRDFGADPSASAATNTAAFNNALAASERVFVPAGTYVVNNITGIRTNSELFGEGWNSVLKQIPTAGANDHILDIRHNASGGAASTASNFQNIRIRDLQVRGPDDTPVFNEHCHPIAMCAVSDVTIENVYFYAFKGDGLYIGSGDTPGIERHNERVTVRKCRFDGVNKANRNGISIVDCDTALIEDNVFMNTTASNMPGAIDIEPDGNLWHRVLNVMVRNNRIENCKAGVIVFIPDYFTYPARGICIESNYINLCGTGIGIENSNASAPGGGLSEGSVDTDMRISNNHIVACGTPIYVAGVKQCFVEKNVFEDCTSHAVFGASGFDRIKSRDVFILENKFMRCGSTSAYGCRIDGITNLKFNENKFTDCGTGISPSSAVDFNMVIPNSVTNFEFIGNSITTPTGKTLSAVTQSGSTAFTIDRARVFGNQFSNLASIFAEARGYGTKSVGVPDSSGTPYDLVIDLPPAASSGHVTHIMAGWTHRGLSAHYAQYVGVVLRGDSGAAQAVVISQTGSAGHSIAIQSVSTTSVTLRLTYSFGGTFSATVFG